MRKLLPVPLCLLAFLPVFLPVFAVVFTRKTGAQPSRSRPAPSRILPPSSSFRFPENQRFVYSAEWHRLNAGIATVVFERTPSGEHLRATAATSGMTSKIYPVHITSDARIEPRTFCTLAIFRHSQEGSRRVDRRVVFDYSSARSRVEETDLVTGRQRRLEFDIPPCVTDIVSGFFYASSLNLAPGLTETFPVSEGGKTSEVRIEVEGRDTVKVPWGAFTALRARAEPVSGPLSERMGGLTVWFTDDGRRIPVKIAARLAFATLGFELERIEPAAGAK